MERLFFGVAEHARWGMLPVALDGEGLQESVGGKTWLGERDSTAVSFHKGRVC